MTVISLQSVQQCIWAAYLNYLASNPTNIKVATPDGNLEVTFHIDFVNTRFNCGIHDSAMLRSNLDALRQWCSYNPGSGWSFGFRPPEPSHHPNTANVTLIGKTPLMFNFHVEVVNDHTFSEISRATDTNVSSQQYP